MSPLIEEKHLSLAREILRAHLATGAAVYIFGSRATGTARPYSDLDLALDDRQQPAPLALLAKMSLAFAESLLPYPVDLVDLNAVSAEFRAAIKKTLVPLSF